jgi:hypothetical protein
MYKIFDGSVVVVVFQSAFYLEIHQNNIFFIFKKLILISAHQNNIFFIFKKLILISAHQNNLKISKIYQFEAKK